MLTRLQPPAAAGVMSARMAWLAGALALAALPAHAAPLYGIVDLGTLGGSTIYGTGINDAGMASGVGTTSGNATYGFRSTGPGTIAALPATGVSFSEAYAINAGGDTAGAATFLTSPGQTHAFRSINGGTLQDLGTLGGTIGVATGINASGQVVGRATTAGDAAYHTFRTTAAGVMNDLGTLGGTNSNGRGINTSGQVVGYSDISGNTAIRAFRTNAAGTMQAIGTLGGTNSYGAAINAAGDVVGESEIANGNAHGFLSTTAGEMIDIGTLGGIYSTALGINAARQIVGDSTNAQNVQHGVLFSGGVLYDLNALLDASGAGWTVTSGRGINTGGQIVGNAIFGGVQHAFLMTPINQAPANDVPEPASAALLLLGLAAFARRRRSSMRA